MNVLARDRRSPLGLFPGQPTPRLYEKQHEADSKGGLEQAPLPDALARKYPNAARDWGWHATNLSEDGYDIRTVQELLGHKDVQTTMVYIHVLNRGGRGVRSPLDALQKAVSGDGRIRPTGWSA
jgi:integrase